MKAKNSFKSQNISIYNIKTLLNMQKENSKIERDLQLNQVFLFFQAI